jgi:hypothetical protein
MLIRSYVYHALGSVEDASDRALINATNVGTIKFTLYVGQYEKCMKYLENYIILMDKKIMYTFYFVIKVRKNEESFIN